MKLKVLLILLLAGTIFASAQSQGYKDGVEYYKAGQYENAKTILLNTINLPGTDKAMANYYLGQTYLSLGDKAAAKTAFDAGLAANPECGYNYVGLGALDLLNGNVDAAKDNFKQAQKLGKKNYEIIVAIARAYYNADPVKFAEEIEKHLAKAHKDSKHKEPSIYILEGDMLYNNQDFGGAASKYEMAINYDNANPEGYVKFANSYFHVNPQFSINKLEEFLQIAPNSALGQRELAEKYYAANHWKKAAELYGKYIQNPNHFPEDKARYAVLLYWGENYTESLNVANEMLAQHPDNFQMLRIRFLSEAKLQQYDAAVRDGQDFVSRFTNDDRIRPNDFITLSESYKGVGQDSLAIVQYEIASNKYPENSDIHKELSSMYNQAGKHVQSAEAFNRYIASLEEPSLSDYLVGSGRWLNAGATAGENQEVRTLASQKGLELINKVIAEAKPDPSYLERKAFLYIISNTENLPNAEAIATLNELLALLDQDPANAENPEMLKYYMKCYQFLYMYYSKVEIDEEKAAQYWDLVSATHAKLNPAPAAAEGEQPAQ